MFRELRFETAQPLHQKSLGGNAIIPIPHDLDF